MNVWLRKTRKKATCAYCGKPILNGEYQVVCQWYVKLRSGRTWQKQKRFHPQCWIDQGIAEIENRAVVETRGKKKLEMTDSNRVARFAVMRRRASVTQRIRIEVTKPSEEQSVDKIIHLGDMLNRLKEEIEQYGGVPESWL